MCKRCVSCCLISVLATWAFFALLLDLLGVVKAGVNAVWLTLLISLVICSCPVMNSKLAQYCECKKVPNKGKKA
jgi:hypothetical protein